MALLAFEWLCSARICPANGPGFVGAGKERKFLVDGRDLFLWQGPGFERPYGAGPIRGRPDGQRFLVQVTVDKIEPLTAIVNWPVLLKKGGAAAP